MVRFLLALGCLFAVLLSPGPSQAQCTGSFPANTVCGTTTGGIPHPIPPPSSGVSSLNSITGAAAITAGSNVTVTPAGQNIQISATGGGGAFRITRSQIPSNNLTGVSGLVLSGYTLPNDDGSGAPYTCVAQSGASLGAIQDSVGNWCAFDLPRVNNGPGWIPGWFGGDHSGGSDSTSAIQQAIDAAFRSGLNKVYCSGTYLTSNPIFFDPPGNLRGAPTWFGQGLQPTGGWSPGSIVTIPNGTTTYVNSSSLNAWGSPLSPDATGMAMDLAYRVVNSNASVTYAPTWTTAFPNGIIIAAFKGSGTIGTPVNIGTAYPETAMGTGFTTTATAPIGSAIFVAVNDISGTGVTSVTDSAGHTYTRVPSFIDNATIGGIFIYYSLNIGSALPSGGTITVNGPGGYAAVATSVTNANGGFDVSALHDNTSTSTNAPTVSTPTLATTNEIVFGALVSYSQQISAGYVEAPGFASNGIANLWTLATWNNTTAYVTGNVVYRSGLSWQALANNTGSDPLNSLAANAPLGNWKPITQTPLTNSFAGTLYGPPQLASGILPPGEQGCIINTNFNNSAALTLGPGLGVSLDGVWVLGPGGGTDCNQPMTGAGITILSDAGGANRTQVMRSGAWNFYWGIPVGATSIQTVGQAGASLGAENKVEKTFVANTCVSFIVSNTQGFINTLFDNTMDGVTAVWNITGAIGTAVYGGNYSHFSQNSIGNKFAVTLSGATWDAGGLKFNGTITLAGDPFLTVQCTDPGTAINDYNRFNNSCHQNIYNSWILWPAGYGLIPCALVAFNPSTGAATWRALDEWYTNWGGNSWGGAALQAAINGQTAIWATEMGRVFVGAGIDVENVHIEPGQPFELVDSYFANGGARATVIRNINMDTDPTFASGYSPGNGLTEAHFFAAQAFPFVRIPGSGGTAAIGAGVSTGGNVILDNIFGNILNPYNGYGENLMIDLNQGSSPTDGRLIMKGGTFARFNFRYPAASSGSGNLTGGSNWASAGSAAFGQGDYETTPFLGILTDTGNGPERMRQMGWNATPFRGVRPAPWTRPCISPTQYVTLLGTLPAISGTTVTYPILWSGQQYGICDWSLTPTTFNAGFTYSIGALVTSASITYVSRVNGNVGNTPASSLTQWAPFHYGFVSNQTTAGFSYGQNITGFTWTNTNNSPIFNVTNTSGTLLFPGLGAPLAGSGAGCTTPQNLIVREVHYNLLYFAVFNTDNDTAGSIFPAFGAASCSNTVFQQAPYVITPLN